MPQRELASAAAGDVRHFGLAQDQSVTFTPSATALDPLRPGFRAVIVGHCMQEAVPLSARKPPFFHLGRLVERGETGKILTNPADPRPEICISGRIG